MRQVNHKRNEKSLNAIEPWQVFRMIGGTSTGGQAWPGSTDICTADPRSLVAVTLGRLRMPVEEYVAAYQTISLDAFTKKNIASRVAGGVLGLKYNTTPLMASIQQVIRSQQEMGKPLYGEPEHPLLKDPPLIVSLVPKTMEGCAA